MTKDTDDASPLGRQADVEGENGKSRDAVAPKARPKEQDPEDVAGRMGSTGKESGIA